MAKNFVESPHKPIAKMPEGDKGGPGIYNGDPCAGLPKRTPTPNGVPEKIFDEAMPKIPNKDGFGY